MNVNSLYQLYINYNFETKDQVYEFISEHVPLKNYSHDKQDIIQQLKEREKIGSPLIAEQVVLPHIESDILRSSKILLIKLNNNISIWDKEIEEVKLIIAILLKKDEEMEVKTKISSFTKELANENFINYLLKEDDKASYYKKLNSL